jgi:Ca-activated chloride channel family protein
LAQGQTPVFRATTNLQSIAVRVTDKHGVAVQDLSAADFSLFENGRRQKIAFFAAEGQPVSLVILLDASRSMEFGGKLERARALLAPLTRGNRPEDEIFLVPFTDQIASFEPLTMEQRLRPPRASPPGNRGSALYDALASALCHLRTAANVQRAVVVVTDGVDQHSRLKLEQLTELVRSSSAQIFTVGLYNKVERQVYWRRHGTVTIAGLREIDNPVTVFRRLAKESGAESFFPSSDQDFQKALDRISERLQTQYTLAYYPARIDTVRRIEVKVGRKGIDVSARDSVGSGIADGGVHFEGAGCTISPRDHPYPWESHVTSTASSPVIYQENFSDPRSGWPDRRFDLVNHLAAYYSKEGYEVYRRCADCMLSGKATRGVVTVTGDAAVAAYGPWWNNFRASATIEGKWTDGASSVGLVFDFMEDGYYALLLPKPQKDKVSFQLVRGRWNGERSDLVPRRDLVPAEGRGKLHRLGVESVNGRIRLWVDDRYAGIVQDAQLRYGLVGFGAFGNARMIVHQLRVEALP